MLEVSYFSPPLFPPSVPPQMIECLKEQKKYLSPRCHQRIFRLQEVEMSDPELDYQLMRVCKQMIKVRRKQMEALGLKWKFHVDLNICTKKDYSSRFMQLPTPIYSYRSRCTALMNE